MNAAARGRFIETAGRKTPPPSADYHVDRTIRIEVATQTAVAAKQAVARLPRPLSGQASGVPCSSANVLRDVLDDGDGMDKTSATARCETGAMERAEAGPWSTAGSMEM
jgi:hypothetical protein